MLSLMLACRLLQFCPQNDDHAACPVDHYCWGGSNPPTACPAGTGTGGKMMALGAEACVGGSSQGAPQQQQQSETAAPPPPSSDVIDVDDGNSYAKAVLVMQLSYTQASAPQNLVPNICQAVRAALGF